jgi:hypothetical protein
MFLLCSILKRDQESSQGADQMHQWKLGHFEAAVPHGRVGVDGLVYRGLGLECVWDDCGGAWYDSWDVTHIASGCRIGTISDLDEDEAFKLATMIADIADWTSVGGKAEAMDLAPELLAKLVVLSDLSGSSFAVTVRVGPTIARSGNEKAVQENIAVRH